MDSLGVVKSLEDLNEKYEYDLRISLGEGTFKKVYRGHIKGQEPRQEVAILQMKLRGFNQRAGEYDVADRDYDDNDDDNDDDNNDENRNDRNIKLLRREVEYLRMTKGHPNIISLLDDNIYSSNHRLDRYYYFIQDKMSEELYDLVNRQRDEKKLLDIRTVKEIALQVGLGIQCLHSLNIAHRDIKLDNIMMWYEDETEKENGNFRVKLIDFGWSRSMSNVMQLSRSGNTRFNAPEVDRDGAKCHSDMWSIGVLLYTLFYNNYPFTLDREGDINDSRYYTPPYINYVRFKRRHLKIIENPTEEEKELNEQAKINRDIIEKLLCDDYQQRLTIEEFLNHRFFHGIYEAVEAIPYDQSNPTNTLMHVNGNGVPLKISTMDFRDFHSDPYATVLTSTFISNDEPYDRNSRSGSLPKMLSRLEIGDNDVLYTSVGDDDGILKRVGITAPDVIRELFTIMTNGETRTWDIYSSLRQNAPTLLAVENTNFYMSLIGYRKRDENGEILGPLRKRKLCQEITQEILNFVKHLTRNGISANLGSFTILCYPDPDLVNSIKNSFNEFGRSGAMNLINNDGYVFNLSARILPGYRGFIENNEHDSSIGPIVEIIRQISDHEREQDPPLEEDPLEQDPLEHGRLICSWGGLVATQFREIENQKKLTNAHELNDKDQFAFIVDKDHAIDILERNARKANENRLQVFDLFDAVTTLRALEYILDYLELNEWEFW